MTFCLGSLNQVLLVRLGLSQAAFPYGIQGNFGSETPNADVVVSRFGCEVERGVADLPGCAARTESFRGFEGGTPRGNRQRKSG